MAGRWNLRFGTGSSARSTKESFQGTALSPLLRCGSGNYVSRAVTFDRFNKLDRRASLERTQTSSERDAAVLSEDSLRGLNLRTDLSLAKIFAVTTLQRYGKK